MKYQVAWICVFFTQMSFAQKMTTEEYIATYKDWAIQSMLEKGIPASITLAQGILESGNGNSSLAKEANNHFGIKCHTGWAGKTMYIDDDAPNECFRKYENVLDSYRDHGDFLTSRSRYSKCFELEITDYVGWAKELKAAGYATSPTYAESLINLIEKYELFQYDSETGYAQTPTFDDITDVPAATTSTTSTTNTTAEVSISDFEIQYVNGVRAVKVKKGQTKSSIATAFGIKVKHIEKYNELGQADEVVAGETIYVEPKKFSAEKGKDAHTVKAGDTFYSISQLYGIKMESLMKKNRLWYGSKLKAGDTLNLRRKKKLS